jgi:hypothetical protein
MSDDPRPTAPEPGEPVPAWLTALWHLNEAAGRATITGIMSEDDAMENAANDSAATVLVYVEGVEHERDEALAARDEALRQGEAAIARAEAAERLHAEEVEQWNAGADAAERGEPVDAEPSADDWKLIHGHTGDHDMWVAGWTYHHFGRKNIAPPQGAQGG